MWQYLEGFAATARDQYIAAKSGMGPLRLSKSEICILMLRKTWHDLVLLQSDFWEDLSHQSPITRSLIAGAVLFFVMLLLDHVRSKKSSLARRSGLPVLQPPAGIHRWDYGALLAEGVRQHPHEPYIIAYSGYEYIVYPAGSFDEVKRLPAATASMIEWFTSVYFQGWRFLGRDNSALHKMLAVDLTRAVPTHALERQQHTRHAFGKALPPVDSSKWTTVPLMSTLMEIVARTNALSLVGPEMGNDDRWLNAVQRFPIAVMLAVFACHSVPRLVRPVISLLAFLPAWFLYWYMKTLLGPLVQQDLQQDEAGQRQEKCNKPEDWARLPIAKWLAARYRSGEKVLSQVTHDLVVTAFESTPSTAGTLYFIVGELVTRPELMHELREEILQAMEKNDGNLPPTYATTLPKLDSVMRESSRVNMFSYLTLFRKVLKPIKLSVGPELPVGALICVDANTLTSSRERWTNPERFEPMRFLRLRGKAGEENQHQFISLGPDAPGWGDGLQACPGRTFAASTIKLILANLLVNYDISLPKGAAKPKRNSMPNGSISPDMSTKILIRKRGQ
ncbi:cytochrome P450 [Xylaria arbuscula]|nr:cytochrome P450 [Xylaria arbuscula]